MRVGYKTHIENQGWNEFVYDGVTSGTVGDGLRMEALIIELIEHEGIDIDVNYQVHVENYGWMDWEPGGEVAGTEGEGLRLEAIRIILVGTDATKYELKYRLHVENIGWQVWYSDGDTAGTEGVALRAEAIEIRIRKLNDDPTEDPDTIPETPVVPDISVIPTDTALAASYSVHIENKGWQKAVHGGIMAGTVAKALRLEAIRINIINFGDLDLGISYETHIEYLGWISAVADGVVSGTTGEGKRLEAIKINLTGANAADYMVWYRGHGQNYGWTEYSHDGEICGTEGEGLRLEAIEILITKAGVSLIRQPGELDGISTRYQTHIENLSWTPWTQDGQTSGTTGRGLRMEAFKLELKQYEDIDVSVSYRGYVENIGWQSWVNEGEVAGTEGQGLRLEALEIILTGSAAADYELLYRVHIENYGWTDFLREGETAGTLDQALRLEAISVILLKKADQSANITNEVVNKIPYVQVWGQNFPFEPFLIHDIRTDYKVADELPLIEGQNKSQSFTFVIDPDHEHYNDLLNLRTTIQVYEIDSNFEQRQVFEGRVLDSEREFDRNKTVICEGELGYLNDSQQRPKKYENMTPEEFLTNILNTHNMSVTADKRFFMGVCTVVNEKDNAVREYKEYKKTFEVVTETVNSLGGYLVIRHIGNIRFLDYLENYRVVNSQPIEFGKNLLDVKKTDFSNGVITALIPYGAEVGEGDEKERLNIKTVNDGSDFIYNPTAVAAYGWIFDSVEFDSVEDPTLLLEKGKEYLDIASQAAGTSITVEAIDLNQINVDIESIKLGDNVRVVSKPHDIDMYLPVTKISRKLGQADQGHVTLGGSVPALTDYVSGTASLNYYGDTTANSIKNLEYVSNELSFKVKVTSEAVTETENRLDEAELLITPTAITETVRSSVEYLSDLNDKATVGDLSNLTDDIGVLRSRIETAELQITADSITSTVRNSTEYINDLSGKASVGDLTTLSGDLDSLENNIGTLTSRVSSAEQQITADAIVSTVTSSVTYINNLTGKANKTTIISEINQSAEGITIDASKVNITGFCTFSQAESLADTAESNAESTAYSYAMSVKNGLSTYGYTTINGGNITTGTVTASRINLLGYLSGSSGFKVDASSGALNCARIDIGISGGCGYITNTGSYDTLIYNQNGSIQIYPLGGYSRIHNLYAYGNTYNVPKTTTTSTTKVVEIAHFSSYFNVNCNGSNYGIYYTVSDRRLKANIRDSEIKALERIRKIAIRQFDWISGDGHEDFGFIAQEIEKSIGENYVGKIRQPNGGINYQIKDHIFTPLLVRGLQELDNKCDEKVAKLEAEIAKLKYRVAELEGDIAC